MKPEEAKILVDAKSIKVVIGGREFPIGERPDDLESKQLASAAIQACLMRQFLSELAAIDGADALTRQKIVAAFESWMGSLFEDAAMSMDATLAANGAPSDPVKGASA